VVNGEWKSSGIELYRQEREPGTVPGVPLKPGTGDLNAGRRKVNSPLQCDILMINPPLKGLMQALPLQTLARNKMCQKVLKFHQPLFMHLYLLTQFILLFVMDSLRNFVIHCEKQIWFPID
jgi:hypothetical protein